MVKRLYDIIGLFKEYLLFALCLSLSLLLLALNDNNQIRAIRSTAVVSVGFMQDAVGFIPNYFGLRKENRALRELNMNLADEVSRLREGMLQNIRLHQLLDLKERGHFRYVSANVVGRNFQPLRNTITIDVGENDGVRSNMPVVTGDGLAGKIVATSSAYSVAQILLNKELRVSAKVQRSRVDGIVRWDGGEDLTLGDVAKTLDVQVGDVVTTSEYSSIFPPGIKIGLVRSARQIPGELFQAIAIAPGVDFPRLEEVFVITYVPDSSRVAVEHGSSE